MTLSLAVALGLIVTATSFLSGLFGMAGGLILIGALLALLPVATAMVLHAVTQIASNAWRGLLWRQHIRWRAVAAYVCGCALALAGWSLIQYVPSRPVAFILLGVTPFLTRLAPTRLKPNPESFVQGITYGSCCMSLMVLTGVAGPLLDAYFLGGRLDRREIVATKAMCQIIGHAMKLAYFGVLIEQAGALDPLVALIAVAASLVGTAAAKPLLLAMSDAQYRAWAGRIVTAIAAYYILHGAALVQAELLRTPAT
ncbi:MAG TPA: TSUP family transporter [Beijerinckiaceae bacterium]|jgi:uncharacterized membrane protein YfcA